MNVMVPPKKRKPYPWKGCHLDGKGFGIIAALRRSEGGKVVVDVLLGDGEKVQCLDTDDRLEILEDLDD